MKFLRCNGRLLEVRDIGPVTYRLKAQFGPIRCHGTFLLEDAVARDWVKRLTEAQHDPALWMAREG
jgi:hypothetical protein